MQEQARRGSQNCNTREHNPQTAQTRSRPLAFRQLLTLARRFQTTSLDAPLLQAVQTLSATAANR